MRSCNRSPEEDQDMDEMMMEMAERERELLDRAEDQCPDWYGIARDLCLPSVFAAGIASGTVAQATCDAVQRGDRVNKATVNQDEGGGRNVVTVASNIPVSGKLIRAILELFPDAEVEYKPINQRTGEIEERIA